jgi:tetratricopeptide (TPR) repeat protein
MASQTESSDRWRRQSDLFHAALEREPAERRAFLEEECAADLELQNDVEALLAAHTEEPSLLDGLANLALDLGAEVSDATEQLETLEYFDLAINPDEVLAERFEIVRLLGRGGMGAVYEARDRELDSTVAVKVLRPEIARRASVQERFRREIQLARQVTHPNACRIFDLGLHGEDRLFLTMEHLEGETLAARLKRDGPYSPNEALPIVEQVVAALSEAHRVGVIHRDLKSGNVMLVPEGEAVRAVVTDFGLAVPKRSGADPTEHITRTGELLGTPAYMAPEQLERGTTSPATDVYALGLMLYEMITGELPFSGDTPISGALQRLREKAPSPRERVPDLDRVWERTILRCLEKDPEERWQTPSEVLAALKGETIPIRWTPRRKRRWAFSGVAAAMVAIVGFLVISHWLIPGTPTAAEALGFAERDWVLIAAFENRTGEEIFDGTLEAALSRDLANSRFVNVVPRQRVTDTLQLMQQPLDATLDASLASEVALRDGGIRAVLTGRAEKLGSAYILSSELVDPGAGVTVTSLSEEAEDQDTVLPAVRRLSSRVRESLGEALPTIRKSERELQAVSTPSLRALQLFSQADQLFLDAIPGEEGFNDEKNRTAEELLREAIAEDPTFASAHNHLAYAIKRQGRPDSESIKHAERAMELVETVTPVERYFIRGSYHGFRNDSEEAIAQYRALLEIEPDHFWATGNMWFHLRRLGRFEDAIPYRIRSAELRPNDWGLASGIAWELTTWHGRLQEAKKYAERALEFPQHLRTGGHPVMESFIEFFAAHQLWVNGEVEKVAQEVERLASTLGTRELLHPDYFAWATFGYYLDLGMLEQAVAVSEFLSPDWRASVPLFLADYRGDGEPWRGYFSTADPRINTSVAGRRAVKLARLGELEHAERVLANLPKEEGATENSYSWRDRREEEGFAQTARGVVAFYHGRYEEAVSLLEEGIPLLQGRFDDRFWHDLYSYEALARSREALGQSDKALEALVEAAKMKPRMGAGRKVYWMENQLLLADFYRKAGRKTEALEIEDELRRYCAFADPDFVIRRELEKRGRNDVVAAATG